jgi:PAS domain S-box-containing protein
MVVSRADVRASEITGYTLAEVTGRPLHDVIHHTHPDGSHFPLEECPIDRAFPEEHQTQGEEVFVHKDGSFYPVAFTATPIHDEEAKSIGTIIEVRDISAEKKAQEHQRLLINELNHRVKNTLATV